MLQSFNAIIQAAAQRHIVMQREHPVHGLKAAPHDPPIIAARRGCDGLLQRETLIGCDERG
jgi:hypothetical protein